jgi:hypothetical protein
MRTTLTLDDDVARRLRRLARQRGCSFKEVVNNTLRTGLEAEPQRRPAPFRVNARDLRRRPGVQIDRISELLERLDEDDAAGAGG